MAGRGDSTDDSTETRAGASREALPAEHRWPVVVAMTGALVLYGVVDKSLHLVPTWVVVAIVVAGLVPLIVVNPHHLTRQTRWTRILGIVVAVAFAAVTQVSIVVLLIALVAGYADGVSMLLNAVAIWLVQVIVFGLLFWELDRGGPVARRVEGLGDHAVQHFRFPQQDGSNPAERRWEPSYVDYGYVALTNMTSFSPTDTMPLTHTAKLLMGWQSLTGFAMLALVIARSVNIIG
jgi:hypothetical protein